MTVFVLKFKQCRVMTLGFGVNTVAAACVWRLVVGGGLDLDW